jgi:hypothetical protein
MDDKTLGGLATSIDNEIASGSGGFSVLNRPSFHLRPYWADGNVFNIDFAQPRKNEGTNRTGRIQLRVLSSRGVSDPIFVLT